MPMVSTYRTVVLGDWHPGTGVGIDHKYSIDSTPLQFKKFPKSKDLPSAVGTECSEVCQYMYKHIAINSPYMTSSKQINVVAIPI